MTYRMKIGVEFVLNHMWKFECLKVKVDFLWFNKTIFLMIFEKKVWVIWEKIKNNKPDFLMIQKRFCSQGLIQAFFDIGIPSFEYCSILSAVYSNFSTLVDIETTLLSSSTILASLFNLSFSHSSNLEDINLTELVKSSSCFSSLIYISLFFLTITKSSLIFSWIFLKQFAKMLENRQILIPPEKTSSFFEKLVVELSSVFFFVSSRASNCLLLRSLFFELAKYLAKLIMNAYMKQY